MHTRRIGGDVHAKVAHGGGDRCGRRGDTPVVTLHLDGIIPRIQVVKNSIGAKRPVIKRVCIGCTWLGENRNTSVRARTAGIVNYGKGWRSRCRIYGEFQRVGTGIAGCICVISYIDTTFIIGPPICLPCVGHAFGCRGYRIGRFAMYQVEDHHTVATVQGLEMDVMRGRVRRGVRERGITIMIWIIVPGNYHRVPCGDGHTQGAELHLFAVCGSGIVGGVGAHIVFLARSQVRQRAGERALSGAVNRVRVGKGRVGGKAPADAARGHVLPTVGCHHASRTGGDGGDAVHHPGGNHRHGSRHLTPRLMWICVMRAYSGRITHYG